MVPSVIVCDLSLPQFSRNRIFDREYAAQFPGSLWLAGLRDEAAVRGWNTMTADVFLEGQLSFSTAVCVSDMVTPYTAQLHAKGVIPVILVCCESPNVAWSFYHKLSHYARRYKHAILFKGAVRRVMPPAQAHIFYWPNEQRDVYPGPGWDERNYSVMVASNKERFAVSGSGPLSIIRRQKRLLYWQYLRLADSLFGFRDLYHERMEAIRYFAEQPGFHLYGIGWDRPIVGFSNRRYQRAAQRAYAGPIGMGVQCKRQLMTGYKFAICFENCVFPGYITEKIFDCFIAGCIPVYFGAPDITDFVPAETFIDFRRFTSFAELDSYMTNITEAEAKRYFESAREFLVSKAFDQFHVDTLVQTMTQILEKELAG